MENPLILRPDGGLAVSAGTRFSGAAFFLAEGPPSLEAACALETLSALCPAPMITGPGAGANAPEPPAWAARLCPGARLAPAAARQGPERIPAETANLIVLAGGTADNHGAPAGVRRLVYRLPGDSGQARAPDTLPAAPGRLARVALLGAESTGKTTLAGRLAERLGTLAAPEFGRLHSEAFGTDFDEQIALEILIGHLAGVGAASRYASGVLIEDTDPLLTAVWCDFAGARRPDEIERWRAHADLYLLCATDAPWVRDGVRSFADPNRREQFQEALRAELRRRSLPFVELSGPPDARLESALSAIRTLPVQLPSEAAAFRR